VWADDAIHTLIELQLRGINVAIGPRTTISTCCYPFLLSFSETSVLSFFFGKKKRVVGESGSSRYDKMRP
jgi:hypothetical protein